MLGTRISGLYICGSETNQKLWVEICLEIIIKKNLDDNKIYRNLEKENRKLKNCVLLKVKFLWKSFFISFAWVIVHCWVISALPLYVELWPLQLWMLYLCSVLCLLVYTGFVDNHIQFYLYSLYEYISPLIAIKSTFLLTSANPFPQLPYMMYWIFHPRLLACVPLTQFGPLFATPACLCPLWSVSNSTLSGIWNLHPSVPQPNARKITSAARG